jgi:hypothetical protein
MTMDVKYTLSDLTTEEVNVIIAGVMELPGKVGINVYGKLRQQLEQQSQQGQNAPQGPLSSKVVN